MNEGQRLTSIHLTSTYRKKIIWRRQRRRIRSQYAFKTPLNLQTHTTSKQYGVPWQLQSGELTRIVLPQFIYPTRGGRGSYGLSDHETGDHVTSSRHMGDPGRSRSPPDNRPPADTEHLCGRPLLTSYGKASTTTIAHRQWHILSHGRTWHLLLLR